ncbi:MAG TPA: cadherin-like beta sandwich domain-containing protein [Polyangiaceae bacterium]
MARADSDVDEKHPGGHSSEHRGSPVEDEQGTGTAEAENAFHEGVRLMKGDDCLHALPKFKESQELHPRAATLLNAATCYARVGRAGTAWKTFQEAGELAAGEGRPDLQEKSLRGMSKVTPAVTQLTLVVAPSSEPLSITVNGQRTANDGHPVPLDPGENVIEASAPRRETWRRALYVNEGGGFVSVEIPELPLVREPVKAATPSASNWRPLALTIGGVGLAGIIAGSILGVSALSSADEMSANCNGDLCNARGVSAHDASLRKAEWSTFAIGFGTLLTATGAFLWFTSPGRNDPTVGIAVSRESVGVSWRHAL